METFDGMGVFEKSGKTPKNSQKLVDWAVDIRLKDMSVEICYFFNTH
jgi:hypothetical protein